MYESDLTNVFPNLLTTKKKLPSSTMHLGRVQREEEDAEAESGSKNFLILDIVCSSFMKRERNEAVDNFCVMRLSSSSLCLTHTMISR